MGYGSVQCKENGYPAGIQALVDELLGLVDAQEGQAHLNWRNAMFVNGSLLFLFPPLDAVSAGRMAGQAVRMLCQQLPGQRLYGVLLLKNVLAPDKDAKWRGVRPITLSVVPEPGSILYGQVLTCFWLI
jgi:hypothetical protein